MAKVISDAYEGDGRNYISVYTSGASFVNNPKSTTKAYTKEQLIDMVNYLIDNCYVTCGDSLFRPKSESQWEQTALHSLPIYSYLATRMNG